MTALTLHTSDMDSECASPLNKHYGQQNAEGVTKQHTTLFKTPPSSSKVLSRDASLTEVTSSGTLAKSTESNVVSIIEFQELLLLM